jgi:hypothetical protein
MYRIKKKRERRTKIVVVPMSSFWLEQGPTIMIETRENARRIEKERKKEKSRFDAVVIAECIHTLSVSR